MNFPATITIQTVGGRIVHLAETEKIAKALAEDGELAITPEGTWALAAVATVFPGAKVVAMKNLAKVKYSN